MNGKDNNLNNNCIPVTTFILLQRLKVPYREQDINHCVSKAYQTKHHVIF